MFLIYEADCSSAPPYTFLAETEADAQELMLSLFEEELLDCYNSMDAEEREMFWLCKNYYTRDYSHAFEYKEINVY